MAPSGAPLHAAVSVVAGCWCEASGGRRWHGLSAPGKQADNPRAQNPIHCYCALTRLRGAFFGAGSAGVSTTTTAAFRTTTLRTRGLRTGAGFCEAPR